MATHITITNDLAFPTQPSDYHAGNEGLTKREYFAALAMQGILCDGDGGHSERSLANTAVNMADALIEALNKDN